MTDGLLAATYWLSQRAPEFEESVWSEVERLLNDPQLIAAEVKKRESGPDPQLNHDLKAATAQLKRVEQGIARLLKQLASVDSSLVDLIEKELAQQQGARASLLSMV